MMTNLKYDINLEDGLNTDELIRGEDEDDCDIYGAKIVKKKGPVREWLKRHTCSILGLACFGIFTVSSVYMLLTSFEHQHVDQTNEVIDLIYQIIPQPDLYSPSDPTPTILIPMILSPEIGRPPRRRRY